MAIARPGVTSVALPRIPRAVPSSMVSPLFRALAQTSSDIIAVLSPPGTVRYASPSLERILGYGAETLAAEGVALLHPDDRELAGAAFARVLGRANGAEHVELRLRHADGGWVWLDVVGTNLLEHGDVRGIVLTARDITERKRTEAVRRSLEDLGRELVGTADVRDATRRIASTVLELFGGVRASVFRLDAVERVLVCVASAGGGHDAIIGQRLPLGSGAVGRALVLRRVFSSPDVLADPSMALPEWNRKLMESSDSRACIGVPLVAGGEPVGALGVVDRAGRQVTEEDVRLLGVFGDHAAIALRNAEVLEQSERSRQFAEAVAEVSRIVAHNHDFEHVAVAIADRARELFRARAATVCRLDRTTGALVGVGLLRADLGDGAHAQPLAYAPGAGLSSVALREGRSLATLDLLLDPRVSYTPEMRERVVQRRLGAMMAIPLMVQGRPVGTLGVLDVPGRVFGSDDIGLAEAFASHAAMAVERARLDDEARTARDFLQSVTENCADTIITTDVTGRVTWVSPSAAEMFGYRPDELVGWPAARLYPGGRDEARAVMQRVRTEGRVRNYMSTFPARAGASIPVSTSISLLRDGDGNVTGTIGIVQDMTDQARAAQELAGRESAFRLLFAANPLPMWVFDTETLAFLEANDAAAAHYGYSQEEFTRLTLGDIRPDIEFRALAAEISQDTLDGRRILSTRRHRLKDGRVIDVEVLRHPMVFQGRPAILAVMLDVTERTRLESELRQTQKMEAVGRLAGGIAHDFNNIVTVIDGRCELLLGRMPAEDPARRDLGIIRGSARRASALTGQLLAFSRKQVLQPRRLDLNTVIGDMTTMLRRLIGEDVELATEPSSGLWTVVADRTQLEQVLMNLAVNARDAMPKGGRLKIATANVELDEVIVSGDFTAPPGRYVRLRVTDSGHGMDEAVRSRVFEPFFTTKPAGQGTGLGLATVFGIVTQSHGAIEVASAPGAGAEFSVYLPAREDAAPTPAAAPTRRAPAPGTETILLVEDEAEVRSLAREALQGHGYTVLEAATPGEALLLSDAHGAAIDLLLADVVMPVMSGRELAILLAERRPGLRVIYMSGYLDTALARHNVVGPDIRLLTKPFTTAELAQAVREVFDTPVS
jgi:two-component system cell cycle sensor histidine kinase/response regulator CckA